MHSIAEGKIDGEIAVVLSDKEEAKALEHAKNAGIAAYHVNPKAYDTKEAFIHKMHSASCHFRPIFQSLSLSMQTRKSWQ